MADTKNTRSSRESGAHDNQARRKVWRPVRKLETPPAPPVMYTDGFGRVC